MRDQDTRKLALSLLAKQPPTSYLANRKKPVSPGRLGQPFGLPQPIGRLREPSLDECNGITQFNHLLSQMGN